MERSLCIQGKRAHPELEQWLGELVQEYRAMLPVSPFWSIKGQVVCPEEQPEEESRIWWDARVWYAIMRMRCDLAMNERLWRWLVVHELLHLFFSEMTDLVQDILYGGAMTPRALYQEQQYRNATDRAIEILTAHYLGYERPGHVLFG